MPTTAKPVPPRAAAPRRAPLQPGTLSGRAAQVLADVVETYGTTGEPIGSKTLVESGKYQLSGASLRNVMSDLEDMGLLTHPHTSAGRIPTAAGYRYYAQNLVEADEPAAAVKQALTSQVSASKSLTALTADLSNTLSQLTNCASLVTAPRHEHDPLEHMDFVRLAGDRVLVIMVTKNGEIENRVIQVPAFVSADDLQKAAKNLKPLVMGQTIDAARTALLTGLAEQRGQVNAMIDQMMSAAQDWGQPVTADGAMVVAGSTQLFQYPELVRDKLQNLIKVFEEKRLLMALVEEVRQGPGVKIFVGADVPILGADDVSVIGAPYGNPSQHVLGTIGVIGPQRMNYKKTLGVVNYTQQLLNRLMNPENPSPSK